MGKNYWQPKNWTIHNIQKGLKKLNEHAAKIGLVSDPHSDKPEQKVDIVRVDNSEALNTPAMNTQLKHPEYTEKYEPVAITTDNLKEIQTGNYEKTNIAIDNFIPNTANNGGENMATTEDQSWWDKNGSDVFKFLATAATIGGNLYNQNQQNKFNANEAEKQRQYELEMANTAHQREANDLSAAGINPIASAALGGADSTGGAAATGATPYYADPQALASTALTNAQIDNMQADTILKGKQSGKTEEEMKGLNIENQYKGKLKELEAQLMSTTNEKAKAEIGKTFKEVHKMEQEIRKMDEEIAILKSEGKIKEAEMKTITRNRRAYAILEMAESATRSVGNLVGAGAKAKAAASKGALSALEM